MSFFRPTGGQLHLNLTNTPSTPVQLTAPNGWQNAQGQMVIRTVIFDGSTSTDVHLAYAPTSAQATAIAGSGGDLNVGTQTAGVISFALAASTYYGAPPDYISIPANSYITMWTAVSSATADVYICPGEETTH